MWAISLIMQETLQLTFLNVVHIEFKGKQYNRAFSQLNEMGCDEKRGHWLWQTETIRKQKLINK